MSVYRETPKCPFCGEVIAKAVYKKHDGNFVGDTFMFWENIPHDCKNKSKFEVPFEMMQFPGVKGSCIHEMTPDQEREEIKNWINEADPHPEQKEDEMLTWFVMAYGALEELCKLKKIKDELDFSSDGNSPEVFENDYANYKVRKSMAWYAANQVIELWKKSDYGANPMPKDATIEQYKTALEDLIEAIPGQTNDKDWWPDSLTDAVNEANKLLENK